MAKKKNNKNNQKVEIVNQLVFSNGVIVSSTGKGKGLIGEGQNIKVLTAPANLISKDVESVIIIKKGNKEAIAEKTEKGYRVV